MAPKIADILRNLCWAEVVGGQSQVDYATSAGSAVPTSHGISDATKHSSAITADRILVSDANGLPSGTIYTNANLASAVGNAHNQFLWPQYSTAVSVSAASTRIIVGVSDTSAARTVTLLTSQCVAGRIYHIKDESLAASVANYIKIVGQGGQLIDGQPEYRITLPGRGVWLFSNGTAWFSHAVALPASLYNALFQDGWDDLVLGATAVNPAGIVGPVVYNQTQSTLDWQDNVDCRADFSFQLPHRWHEATDTHFHLHVLHADASAGNSRWSVKWRILDRDEAQPAWTTDATISIAAPGSTDHVLLPIKSFAMAGYRVSCIVQVQLTRLASTDALDTYEADIQMMSADLHYQSDTMTGSIAEGVK